MVLAILAVAVAPSAILAQAQDDSGAADPFDMVTDADGNGISDDFENAFNSVQALAEGPGGASGDNQAAVHQAIMDFAARVPLHPRTRRLQGHIGTYHGIMMQDITDRRRQVIADKIERIEQRIRDTDPVYVAMLQYLDTLNEDAFSAETSVQGSTGHTTDDYEDLIHRVGDIMYRDRPGKSLSWFWSKNWDHVGMYAGDGQVYDSDTPSGERECHGVARRPISNFIDDGIEVQFGELRNSRGRSSVPGALSAAVSQFGDNCTTGYNRNFLARQSTSKLYCSQLVWRTYGTKLGRYNVNLDSNHWRYLLWLQAKYTTMALPLHPGVTALVSVSALTVGLRAIAPDEIALDGDVRNYWSGVIPTLSD